MFSIQASKEWLLDFDIGVFWVVMRVLACGGFGVLVWEGCTGQVAKRKNIEVRDDIRYDNVYQLMFSLGSGQC